MEKVIVLVSLVSEEETWRKQAGDVIAFFPEGHVFGRKEKESYLPVVVESEYSVAELNTIYCGYVSEEGIKNRFYIPLEKVAEDRVYSFTEFLEVVKDKVA